VKSVSQELTEPLVIPAFLEFVVYPEKLAIEERMAITENLGVLECLESLAELVSQEFQVNAVLREYLLLAKRVKEAAMENQV